MGVSGHDVTYGRRTLEDDMYIIEAEALKALLGERHDVCVLDARRPEEMAAGVIPGAQPIDLYDAMLVGSDKTSVEAYAGAAAAACRAAGVANDARIVVYEASSGIRAARAVWTLIWLGHPQVFILNGGLEAWVAIGGSISAPGNAKAQGSFEAHRRDEVFITANEIAGRLQDGQMRLLDVRGPDEFLGTDEPDCDPRPGRIPCASWLYWRELESQGRFCRDEVVGAVLTTQAITSDQEVVVYCHRGARSAYVWLALRKAGVRVRNYLGSWHEWSRREHLPACVGEPDARLNRRA